METECLISVIVPIYNVEHYLAKCIETIINQTYANLEIILVDDESPDNCPAICEEYAARDARIKVIHKKNGGLSDARNHGLDIAAGEYIAFVDSDDYIAPDMIEKLYQAARASQADLAIGSINYVDEDDKIMEDNQQYAPAQTTDSKGFWNLYFSGICVPLVVAWNKLYARHLFEDIRYDVGKYNEDEFIIHKIVERCQTITMIDDKIYNYRQRQNSIMNTVFSIRHLDALEAYCQRGLFFIQNGRYDDSQKMLEGMLYYMIRAYFLLDMNVDANRKRYYEIKKMYSKVYWKNVFHGVSARFMINGMIFLLGDKLYIRTHWNRIKEYSFCKS